MTIQQLKHEIQRRLDDMPEEALQHLLNYLEQAEGANMHSQPFAKRLQHILEEDQKLLELLAK